MSTTIVPAGATRTSSVSVAGGDTLDVLATGTLGYTGSSQAVSWTGGATPTTIAVDGTITALGGGARGIDTSGTPTAGSSLFVTIGTDGVISSNDDAIREKTSFAGGTISIVNAGIIASGTVGAGGSITGSSSGQGLDFAGVTDASTQIVIVNQQSAEIGAADNDGIRGGAKTSIFNAGLIIGESANGDTGNDGIDFQTAGTGTITNEATGVIIGARHGITGKLAISLSNAGTLEGQLGSGINLDTTSGITAIDNTATGLITGHAGGATDGDAVDVDYLVDLRNDGTILATGTSTAGLSEAVTIGGGTIDNLADGLITSDQRAITVDDSNAGNAPGATTITNAGTIVGGNGQAIAITDLLSDTLINSGTIIGDVGLGGGDDSFSAIAGSALIGTIDGGDGIDVATLSGSGAGTLDGIINFESLVVTGGEWVLKDSAPIANITLAGGQLELTSSDTIGVTGVAFAGRSTLLLDAGVAPIGAPAGITISGFEAGDQIDVGGIDDATAHVSYDSLTHRLAVSDASGAGTWVRLAGSYDAASFTHTSDGAGGTTISIACFLRGTRISTPAGEVAVEALRVGDLVRTQSGADRPLSWVGSGRALVTARNVCDLAPVIIRAGALADGVPRRDLHVTRQHAIRIGDGLVPAEHLVNGVSVVWDERTQAVEYFHLALDSHDILLAEGAPAESFRDDDSASGFDQASGAAPAPWAPSCLPIVRGGLELEGAWAMVADRAGAVPPGRWVDEPDLHVVANGVRLDPLPGVSDEGNVLRFALPAGTGEALIVSRHAVPNGDDCRRLGVALAAVTVTHDAVQRVLAIDTVSLDGFHDWEPGVGGGHRWTKGTVRLPAALLAGINGEAMLTLRVIGCARYRSPILQEADGGVENRLITLRG